ncbi:hypothetical protein PAEPH01_1024 [Pancytospora epiphaga]|nr:hypothetical protein PAEPH01_1024 [Pancytospora epiphaga]
MLRMQISGRVYSFDPVRLPLGPAFKEIVDSLVSGTAAPLDLVELAYLYRNDIERAKQLLEIARSKSETEVSFEEGVLNEIKISMLGLLMHHNIATEIDFFEFNNLQDKRIDLLKGFYLYRKKNFEDAQFLFNKVGYRTGIDLCRIAINGRDVIPKPRDPRMLCYVDSGEWVGFESNNVNKDFLFRIGKNTTPDDPNNIDSRIELLEQEINKGGYDSESIISKLEAIKEIIPDSPEIYYLIGKIFHLQNDYERAKEYYDISLTRDPSYVPAMFNLRRISGKLMPMNKKNGSICDYNAIVNLRNGVRDFDYSNCSSTLRRVCMVVSKVGLHDASVVADLRKLQGSQSYGEIFDKEVVMNNLAVLQLDKGIKILENMIYECNDRYEDYIKYNIGVIKGDVAALTNCGLAEAKLHLALLKEDTNVEDEALRGYILMDKDRDAAKGLFERHLRENSENIQSFISDPVLFASICLGSLFIDDYLLQSNKSDISALEKAATYFIRARSSFYGINGLGIFYALRERFSEAISTFKEVTEEYNLAYFNIAHCYILKGEYRKALESLMNLNAVFRDEFVESLVRELCRMLGDQSLVSQCIKQGFLGLDLDISPKVKPDVFKPVDKSEARKRKIQEIEEARKRLNLQ